MKVIGRWVTFRCIVLGILNKLHYIFGVFGGILGYYGYFLGYYGYFGLLWGVFFKVLGSLINKFRLQSLRESVKFAVKCFGHSIDTLR